MLTAILRTGLLARSLTHGAELKFTAKNQTLITMSIFFNFCDVIDDSLGGLWHGVKNALGVLHLAVDFYKLLLLVWTTWKQSWEKAEEEEEILKIIPRKGSKAQPILAHFQPVNPAAVRY